MTTNLPPAAPAADGAATLAPIVLNTSVPCPPERAFEYFTRDIGRWWPLAEFSCAGDDAADVHVEPRIGGGIVESAKDGTSHRWGTVQDWQPGKRVAFTWHPGRDAAQATAIDVTFAATAQGTLVTLTHGGWDVLGERGAAARSEYSNGWPRVFGELYAAHCRQASKGSAR